MFCRFCAIFCGGAAYDDVIIGSAVAVDEDGAGFVRVVLFGAVNGFDVEEDGVTGLTGYWKGAFPGPFAVCKSQVREGVDVVELPQFVRARDDVEGTVVEVGGDDVGEDAYGSFVSVFKISGILVQVFGMASDGFFVPGIARCRRVRCWDRVWLRRCRGWAGEMPSERRSRWCCS